MYTSGTIHEAHQNSWEVLEETQVSFVICRPPGKASLTKWQLLSLQIRCLTTGLGFFVMHHSQLGSSENFLSFLECKLSHKYLSPMALIW